MANLTAKYELFVADDLETATSFSVVRFLRQYSSGKTDYMKAITLDDIHCLFKNSQKLAGFLKSASSRGKTGAIVSLVKEPPIGIHVVKPKKGTTITEFEWTHKRLYFFLGEAWASKINGQEPEAVNYLAGGTGIPVTAGLPYMLYNTSLEYSFALHATEVAALALWKFRHADTLKATADLRPLIRQSLEDKTTSSTYIRAHSTEIEQKLAEYESSFTGGLKSIDVRHNDFLAMVAHILCGDSVDFPPIVPSTSTYVGFAAHQPIVGALASCSTIPKK